MAPHDSRLHFIGFGYGLNPVQEREEFLDSHGLISPSELPSSVSPYPARTSTLRIFFRWPFSPTSPAKHNKASLIKQLGVKHEEGSVHEEGVAETEQSA